jgi:type IV pilus assembly protein PilV
MKLNSIRNRRPTTCGFSLLELLVTLVVLSIGLLGLGLMQTTGLGLTKTAYSRTQAMMLASDIADRIRANEAAAANYVGNSATTPSSSKPPCTAGSTCPGPALAASDMADWSNRLLLELPGGRGQILDAAAVPAACKGYTATTVGVGFMRVLILWNEANSATITENRTGGNTNGDCYQFDFVF